MNPVDLALSGTITGYAPEWLDGDKWRNVTVYRSNDPSAIPMPANSFSQVLGAIGLMDRTQAMAIAWSFAARRDCEMAAFTQVRTRKYTVKFDITAEAKPDTLDSADGTKHDN